MSHTMRQQLSRSNYVFSGLKTFHELNEAFPPLVDENGNRNTKERKRLKPVAKALQSNPVLQSLLLCHKNTNLFLYIGKHQLRIYEIILQTHGSFHYSLERLGSLANYTLFGKRHRVNATHRAATNRNVTPVQRHADLIGTKYEGKCPDLNIDGKWYEHEGFTSENPKRALKNMLNHGLKQSNRLIIDRPELEEWYIMHNIITRVKNGQDIQEVWLREKDGSLKRLYVKESEE